MASTEIYEPLNKIAETKFQNIVINKFNLIGYNQYFFPPSIIYFIINNKKCKPALGIIHFIIK